MFAFLAGGVAAILASTATAAQLGQVLAEAGVATAWLGGSGGVERWVAYPTVLWLVAFGGYTLGAPVHRAASRGCLPLPTRPIGLRVTRPRCGRSEGRSAFVTSMMNATDTRDTADAADAVREQDREQVPDGLADVAEGAPPTVPTPEVLGGVRPPRRVLARMAATAAVGFGLGICSALAALAAMRALARPGGPRRLPAVFGERSVVMAMPFSGIVVNLTPPPSRRRRGPRR